MRSELIRIYKSVHTWTGIVAGMALFVAFYAGAITIFKEPLARWAAPPSAMHGSAISLNEASALIVRTLREQPAAAKDFRLNLKAAEHLPRGISWQVREQGADDHDHSSSRHYVATLEADSRVRAEEVHPSGLADFIDTLHRVVGLPADTDPNRWVMGIIAALYAMALVSGVIVLLPSLVKDLFALRVSKNLKRMWLDAHNVVGIISLPFHIVMALTAIVFAYHDGFYAIQDKLIHDGKWSAAAQARGSPAAPATPRDPAAMLPPADLLASAQALSPSFEVASLQYLNATGPRATVRVWGHDPAAHSPRFVGGFVAVDPYSGKIMNADFLPGRQNLPNAIVASFFALHFGTYGGAPVQWMYFLLSLAGAWLFYGGNLLWVETRRIKAARASDSVASPPEQRRDVRWMAAATVGVCLGAVCGISLTIVAAKWLHGRVEDLNTWHQGIYYAVFFSALVWAFQRGAARSAVHLLWLAAAFTFAIPATSLLAWLLPSLGMWTHGSAAALGVDATALAGGLSFVWLARATMRRVMHGPADSIWSIRHEKI
ncbi:PepSY-associated TM helix domain-containing protein [Ferribacterium limneticum]|uniref:PepSY-associated TM helix domain-containing protein n=1 Tax=Ferribacterium limneticum TaxID=76259 RepID=UPI001CFB3FB4|nr:PepSY-associated TM helix domain-containing protein [Ferribacterium limneticum]UCV27768.1 PepSY domain-containing protein [Ferribacterium limneticum]UCV31685.1 PepSY domain-containing protein [Ferribacterium limneticum]